MKVLVFADFIISSFRWPIIQEKDPVSLAHFIVVMFNPCCQFSIPHLSLLSSSLHSSCFELRLPAFLSYQSRFSFRWKHKDDWLSCQPKAWPIMMWFSLAASSSFLHTASEYTFCLEIWYTENHTSWHFYTFELWCSALSSWWLESPTWCIHSPLKCAEDFHTC